MHLAVYLESDWRQTDNISHHNSFSSPGLHSPFGVDISMFSNAVLDLLGAWHAHGPVFVKLSSARVLYKLLFFSNVHVE